MPSIPSDCVPVGRIAGLFGVRGELKCDPTSSGRSLFTPGAVFHAQLATGAVCDITLESVREHKARLLIRIASVTSPDDAQTYAGALLIAQRSRITLAPGEYLDRDLEGCTLQDEGGSILGVVDRVEHYPGSDMLVVNGKLVPMVREFIRRIEPGAKRIVVALPPGLLDEENAERG